MFFLLSQLCVLITKPLPKGNELAAKVVAEGGKAIVFPTFRIEDCIDKVALERAVKKLKVIDLAIFVSPNAVEKTLPLWRIYWPTIPAHLSIAAVGKGTQEALSAYGIASICPEALCGSEALLSLPALQGMRNKTVMIFQGETGRGLLQASLLEGGAKVITVVAYRRVLETPISAARVQEWRRAGVNCVVYTSEEGMLNLFKLAPVKHHLWLKGTLSLVVSERLVETAQRIKIQTIVCSRGARAHQILETLKFLEKRKDYE